MKHISNFLLLLLYTITMIICFVVYGKQQNTNLELNNKVDNLKYELEQSEARCKRMTDTCIDILANKRWE